MSAQRAEPIPAEVIERKLEAVLSRPEFDQEPSLLQQILEWFTERFDLDAHAAASVTKWLVIAFGILLAASILLLVVRSLFLRRRQRQAGGGEDSARALVATRVTRLRRMAEAARRRGELSLALRYLFFALVVGLGQRGNLHYRDSWTNRELLERGRPTAEVRRLLEPLLDEFEAKEFGREPTRPGDVWRLEELCERWLGRLGREPE